MNNLKIINWVPINSLCKGELIAKDEWVDLVDKGIFVDFKGYGYIATEDYCLVGLQIFPSDVAVVRHNPVWYILWMEM